MAHSPPWRKGLTVPNANGSASSLSSCQSGDSSHSPAGKRKKTGFMRVLKRKNATGKDSKENRSSSDTETSILVPVERPKNFAKVLAQIRERAMPLSRKRSKTMDPPFGQTGGESEQASSKTNATSESLTRGRSNTTLSATDEETTELDSFDDTLYCQDEVDSSLPDSEKTRQAIEHLRRKIEKIKEQIKQLQEERDESVKEYLKSTDRSLDQQRVKVQFEKKNQKTNSTISHLQKKLEKYHNALVDLEENGATYSGHSSAKEVLRGVKENIRGLSGGVRDGVKGAVTKPLEIANLIKNKFGSAENVSATGSTPGSRADGIDEDLNSTDQGEGERYTGGEPDKSITNLSPRYNSDDDSSSLASATHISSLQANPTSPRTSLPPSPPVCYDEDIGELKESNARLQENMEDMKQQLDILAKSLQDERFKSEHLRCQLNDLTNQWNDMIDLHQNEMASLKQELERAEERIECVEYRSAERAGEIEDSLDTYVTRITKIENVQQQNQQMMGGFDNYLDQSMQAKALLSKFLSVVLAILAIVLIIFTTVTRIIQPFTRTKTRLLVSSIVVLIIGVWWRYQDNEHVQTFHSFVHEHLFRVITDRIASLIAPVRQFISRRTGIS